MCLLEIKALRRAVSFSFHPAQPAGLLSRDQRERSAEACPTGCSRLKKLRMSAVIQFYVGHHARLGAALPIHDVDGLFGVIPTRLAHLFKYQVASYHLAADLVDQ